MPGSDIVFWASEPESVISSIVVRPLECDRLLKYLVDPEIPSRVRYSYVASIHHGHGSTICAENCFNAYRRR
jgi:hypothetical protein